MIGGAAIRVATRGSALATTQTRLVVRALEAIGAQEVELVRVRTDGDRLPGPLASLGGTGVFVTALREALLDGRADVAVHSLKDLPTGRVPGLVLAAVPAREDPRDALVARDGLALDALPHGARVGTGSPRRRAQLLALRPDLDVVDLRGNVDTRLARVSTGNLDAVVLAAAGLARLGRSAEMTDLLDTGRMLPAPGQGALAVECRAVDVAGSPVAGAPRGSDDELRALVALIDDGATRLAVTAERALLESLEAGCSAPVGALAQRDDGSLTLTSNVTAPDGSRTLRRTDRVVLTGDPDADLVAARELGSRAARALLDDGAADLAELGPRGPR